jgi:hypothetical protein
VTAAEAILSRELGIIEGARKLSSLRFEVRAEHDEDFILFVGIDSETDHLPVGKTEAHWNPAVLKGKKMEIEKFEGAIRGRAFQACRNLVSKYRG